MAINFRSGINLQKRDYEEDYDDEIMQESVEKTRVKSNRKNEYEEEDEEEEEIAHEECARDAGNHDEEQNKILLDALFDVPRTVDGGKPHDAREQQHRQ